MQRPPLDNSGQVDPHDHEEILDGDRLIRRIDPVQHIVDDENRACRRISTKAFQPSSAPKGGMSVDIERLIVASGDDPKRFVTTPRFAGSVCFSASVARNLGLQVGWDPLTDNPHHGEVWGSNRPNRFSSTQSKGLQQACIWYVAIPGVQTA